MSLLADNRHNGWANYETWLVNAWLTNDGPEVEAQLEMIAQTAPPYRSAAERLHEYVDEWILPEMSNGLGADLIRGGLSKVDWMEIVQRYSYPGGFELL